MEVTENGFLEEFLSLRRGVCEAYPSGVSEFLCNSWDLDTFNENPVWPVSSNPSFSGFMSQVEPLSLECHSNESSQHFFDDVVGPSINVPPLFLGQDDHNPPSVEGEMENICKIEVEQASEIPEFTMGSFGERKVRTKKADGQPSKNLMAERRRRKRLNDRLSMLRSIVPKISKMDRTSILGDTIDYMKELLERINKLQDEEMEAGMNHINLLGIFNEAKPNETVVRNSPKFEVERLNTDTQIEICCGGKPGLLLSTVNTLEALGLEIQQCVISCFNDFSVQASCSEVMEQRTILSSDDIKEALYRNAGYGGRC